MWLAVIIFVCLAVEVLSELSGGEIKTKYSQEGNDITQTSL